MMKETTALILCLSHGKQRFVTLLTIKDPTKENSLSAKELLAVLKKMRPPVSQEALEFILTCLPQTKVGKLEYLPLVNGSILQYVEDYFNASGDNSGSTTGVAESSKSITSQTDTERESPDPLSQGLKSTMSGERGRLSTAYKEEEIKQFEALMEFCRENNIVFDEKFAEKGRHMNIFMLTISQPLMMAKHLTPHAVLLLPPDHSRQSCLESLRQPGLRDLLSKDFSEPPQEDTKVAKPVDIHERFGGAYRELKSKRKPKAKPSTKSSAPTDTAKPEHQKVKLKPDLDCWLTFKEYKKWTE